MTFVEGCEECKRLSSAYEAATMEWFRLQGQLRIAEFSRDKEASHQIVAELNGTARRRQSLREEIEAHHLKVHSRTTTASNC
ncbi:MAG TPA: hypothetical protein VK789_28475 [Bryobacteraceae bacterium]|nr:hypothetical protein [Bryobacteraceae bacterium]